MTTRVERKYLRRLAERMIYLERRAQRYELDGEQDRADDVWFRRETVQWTRSLLLRDCWARDTSG